MEIEAVQTTTTIIPATFNIQQTIVICRMSLVTFKNIFEKMPKYFILFLMEKDF